MSIFYEHFGAYFTETRKRLDLPCLCEPRCRHVVDNVEMVNCNVFNAVENFSVRTAAWTTVSNFARLVPTEVVIMRFLVVMWGCGKNTIYSVSIGPSLVHIISPVPNSAERQIGKECLLANSTWLLPFFLTYELCDVFRKFHLWPMFVISLLYHSKPRYARHIFNSVLSYGYIDLTIHAQALRFPHNAWSMYRFSFRCAFLGCGYMLLAHNRFIHLIYPYSPGALDQKWAWNGKKF